MSTGFRGAASGAPGTCLCRLIHTVPLVRQMPGHLPDAVEGRIQELPVDQLHQSQVPLPVSPNAS